MNAAPRFREMTLEDGERVQRLRGGRGVPGWKSNRPHWGTWGPGVEYVLVPSSQPRRRARVAMAQFPGLTNRSSDAEVLLLGPPEVILRLVTQGPTWCRALVRASLSDEERARRRLLVAAAREKSPIGKPETVAPRDSQADGKEF
jgi:hypothetical protein